MNPASGFQFLSESAWYSDGILRQVGDGDLEDLAAGGGDRDRRQLEPRDLGDLDEAEGAAVEGARVHAAALRRERRGDEPGREVGDLLRRAVLQQVEIELAARVGRVEDRAVRERGGVPVRGRGGREPDHLSGRGRDPEEVRASVIGRVRRVVDPVGAPREILLRVRVVRDPPRLAALQRDEVDVLLPVRGDAHEGELAASRRERRVGDLDELTARRASARRASAVARR